MSDVGEGRSEATTGVNGTRVAAVPAQVEETTLDAQSTGKRRRERTDMTEYVPTLLEFWQKGMREKTTPGSIQLLKEAAEKTGLKHKTVEKWMYNHNKKQSTQGGPPPKKKKVPSFLSDRKTSGYNLFQADFFRNNQGKTVTADAGRAWAKMKENKTAEYRDYISRAAELEAHTSKPTDCSEEERRRAVSKLQTQMMNIMSKMRMCGVDIMAMTLDHHTNKTKRLGTDAGIRFLQENATIELKFVTALTKESKDESNLQEEAREFLNNTWYIASGKKSGFPYAQVRRGEVVVEGLPEGFDLKQPRDMKESDVKLLLSCRDRFKVRVLTTNGPLAITSSEPSAITSGVPSAIISGVPSAITSGGPSAITSGGPSAITSGGPSAITSGVTSAITSGGPSAITSGGPSAITSGVPSATTSGVPSATTSGVPAATTSSGPSATITSADYHVMTNVNMAALTQTGGGLYEVEALLGKRRRKNKTEYLVKWKGYGHHDNSWETAESLKDTMGSAGLKRLARNIRK
ncbi:uncharacterized protein LOC118432469 [Branchiostoma floridae]|uniref:Uncharacterized protein LOC118432469 n=2 Tax=Branchiostoma floridae TaxID=7739 RepID=A0A9J7MFQ8_BRAFL|nr:uncharacterized protein LOC118432469 [Branchiostoma floridae]